jgi:hypothetical protein
MINIRSLLNDVDVSPLFDGWRPKFRTQLLFRSGKIAMLDEDSSNEVHIYVDDIINHTGNVNLHIPAFTDDDDTILLQNHPQIINNKVFGENIEFTTLDIDSLTINDSLDMTNGSIINAVISGANNTLSNIATSSLVDSANFAMKNAANTFTTTQKIQYNATVGLTMYHPTSTNLNGTGFAFNLQNSTPAEITYAYIFGLINQNTANSEQGAIAFYTRNGASLAERMSLDHLSRLRVGINTAAIRFDPTGLTTIRDVTFPNENIKALGEASIQPITNKEIDNKLNTILRHSRYGRYSPSEETGGKGEGALSGLVGVGTRGTSTQNTAGKYDVWNTRAVIDDCAGVLKLDSFTCQRISNPLVRFAFLFESSANRRVFKGLGSKRLINTNSNTAPLNSGEAGIFFGHGVGDSTWQIFHNDASGTCVKTNTGITIPAISTNYIVEIKANDSTPNFVVTFYSVVSPGIRSSILGTPITITTDIPAQTTSLYLQDLIVTTDGSIQSNKIHYDEVFA